MNLAENFKQGNGKGHGWALGCGPNISISHKCLVDCDSIGRVAKFSRAVGCQKFAQ